MTKKTETATPRKSSRPVGETPKQKNSRRWMWVAVGAAIALLVILAGVALWNNRSTAPVTPAGSTVAERVGQPVDRRTIGKPDAPVTIVAYEDFQCPHCQDFTAALEKTILDDLVASGAARFEFKPRFVIGPESTTAAMAAECAADQGRFWEYHDILFDSLRKNPRANQISDFEKLAVTIGLDASTFDKCLESQKHKESLLREDVEARDKGVNATPTVFLNDVKYEGAFEPEAFKAAVEKAKTEATG